MVTTERANLRWPRLAPGKRRARSITSSSTTISFASPVSVKSRVRRWLFGCTATPVPSITTASRPSKWRSRRMNQSPRRRAAKCSSPTTTSSDPHASMAASLAAMNSAYVFPAAAACSRHASWIAARSQNGPATSDPGGDQKGPRRHLRGAHIVIEPGPVRASPGQPSARLFWSSAGPRGWTWVPNHGEPLSNVSV